MTDYLTLEEVTAGRKTKFVGIFPTVSNTRHVLQAMAKLIAEGEKHIIDALDKAGANTDNGNTYLCRYDLRNDVEKIILRAVSDLNKNNLPNKPADIVRHAIDTLETPRKLIPAKRELLNA